MKLITRTFLFNMFALWFTSQILPTLLVTGGWQGMMLGGAVLGLLMLTLAPLLRILFIPINIITFGLASWVVNVVVLYILTIFVPEIRVVEHTFPQIAWGGFIVPQFHAGWTVAIVISSLVVTGIANLLHAISEG
jgi:putative membrane protein